MAIVYRQVTTRQEWRRGTFSLRLSVSADYASLFPGAPGADVRTVRCVKVGPYKKDLEDADGKFVEDEQSLEVDSLACQTADERAVLQLMLEAVDDAMPRYVLIEVAEGGSSTFVQEFRGALRSDIQGNDSRWYGPEYNPDPTPERAYKFAAKSYNLAVTEQSLSSLIPESPLDSGHTYATEWADFIDTKVSHRLASSGFYPSSLYRWTAVYFTYLVDINDALRYMADRIQDATGLTILIKESPLAMAFGTPELVYNSTTDYYAMRLGDQAPLIQWRSTNTITGLKFGDSELGPLVSLRLLQPVTDTNKPFSWHRSKTFGGLCFNLARAFGMFAQFSYDNLGNLTIEFRSRENIYKDGTGATKYVYARDVTAGSIKTQPTTINAEKERWQGFINQFAKEGADTFRKDQNAGYQRSPLVVADPPKEKLLAVTIGATQTDTYNSLFANIDDPSRTLRYRKLWNTGWVFRRGSEVGATDPPATFPIDYAPTYPSEPFYEIDPYALTTALYVRTEDEKYYQVTGGVVSDTGRRYDSVRPVTQVDVEIDGVQESFTELAEYVNRLKGIDGKYFENEYELTVPYLSAFRLVPDGADSFFHIDLGSTLTIDTVDYVVVGIERDYDAVSTKLRLHALTRFSIFATPALVNAADIDGGAVDPTLSTEGGANVDTWETGMAIERGWAVSLDNTGKAIKALPILSHYNKVVGIALQDAPAGSIVSVCTSGVCTVPDSYSISQALWLRDGDPNMDNDRIGTPTTTEHVDQKIGTCVGANSVEVNIGRPFIWYGHGG